MQAINKKIQNWYTFFLIAVLIPTHTFSQGSSPSTPERYASETLFWEAFEEINLMLSGQNETSFKRAVFLTENAFHEGQLNYEAFNAEIEGLVELCQLLTEQKGLRYTLPDSQDVKKNAAIFSVLRDSIPLHIPGATVWKTPFEYDFQDFFGKQNWTKQFVSKLFEEESGNCHSLPYLYRILAEKLGAPAWLAMAPNHIYIKSWNQEIGMYNTELTSGIFPFDAWIMASGYVHIDAVKNEVFLDTLSSRESVASCLLDLAQGYYSKYGIQDGQFILAVCEAALKEYPQFANARLFQVETERKLFVTDLPKSLKNGERLHKLTKKYKTLHDLGYRRMPDDMYLDWLSMLPVDAKKVGGRDSDSIRPPPHYDFENPFREFGDNTKVLTLSGGKYIEAFDMDSIVRIGQALYDWKHEKLTGFISDDTLYTEYGLQPAVVSRWLSLDPLAKEFPNWSPYVFTNNNPIRLVDVDGRAPHDPLSVIYQGLREVFNYIYIETAVDMATAPAKGYGTSSYTARGFQRNPRHYWNALLEQNPEWFSTKNRARISGKVFKSPMVDPTWVESFSTHSKYIGDELIHHHHNSGRWAFALPRRAHQSLTLQLHAITNLMQKGQYGVINKYIPTHQKFNTYLKKFRALGKSAGKKVLPLAILMTTYNVASASPGADRREVVSDETDTWVLGGIGGVFGGFLGGPVGAFVGGIGLPVGMDELETSQDPKGFYKQRMKNLRLSEDEKFNMTACFTEETEVFTPHGFAQIGALLPGDSVYAINLETESLETSVVTKTMRREVQEIYIIVVENDTIQVTGEHPFYLMNRGWVQVKDLEATNIVFALSEEHGGIMIGEILRVQRTVTVVNLTVDGNSNYLVSRKKVLVHNKDCVAAGTEISMTNGLTKLIEHIEIGDSIRAFVESKNEFANAAVEKIQAPFHENFVTLRLSNGQKLTCTKDHPVWISEIGWCSFAPEETFRKYHMPCGQLAVGYQLKTVDNTAIMIVDIVENQKRQVSYNLSRLSQGNGFIANGVVVSNEQHASRLALKQ